MLNRGRAVRRGGRRLAAVLCATGLVVAACGSDDDEADDGGDDTTVEDDDSSDDTTGDDAAADEPGDDDSADTAADGTQPAGDDGAGSEGEFDGEAELVHGITSPAASYDAHTFIHSGYYEQYLPIYDPLIGLDLDRNLAPTKLATDWQVSDDGLTITLTLRDDATFHDGSPVDAEAVKANLERGKSLEGSTVAVSLEAIDTIEAPDATTVVITLSTPDASVLASLSLIPGMIMNPAMFDGEFPTDADGLEGIGSGAYRLVEWRPNEGETFEKVDTYWNPDVVANAPRRVSFVFAPDVNTKLNALRTGEWTSFNVSGAEEQSLELADSDDGFAVLQQAASVAGVFLGVETPPFDQPEARQAVAHAIDPETLTSTLLAASCGTVANVPMGPGDHWSVPDGVERTYPYDPDAARELVDGLGGLSFTMDFSPGTGGEPIANALQAQFADVGMDVTIEGVPGGQSVPSFLRGEYPALTNFVVGQPDPELVVRNFFTGGYSVSRDPAIAEAAAAANDATLSQDERGALYADVWASINEEASFVPICYTSGGFAYRSDIDFSLNPYTNSGVDWSAIRVAAG